MKYVQPVGAAENAPYIDGNPATGIEGSAVPAAAIEHPQREILSVIAAASITPSGSATNQLLAAIETLIAENTVTVPAATMAVKGVVELATSSEAAAGIDNTRAVTPAGLSAAIAAALGLRTLNVGDMFFHLGTSAPAGALEVNGAAGLSRTSYASLFSHLNTAGLILTEGTKSAWQFGDGDGSTTFSLADWRAYSLRAWDHGRGIDPGRALGSYQADELKSHSHTIAVTTGPGGNNLANQYAAGLAAIGGSFGWTTSVAGAAENLIKNGAVMLCIQYA